MSMPAGAPDLTLGGVLADLSALTDEDCSPAVRAILERIVEGWTGAGCPAGKKPGQEKFYQVYFRPTDGHLVGGNPQNPPAPHDLGELGSSTGIAAVLEGYAIDVTGGDTVAWDPTEISGYDAGQRQYLRNDNGTIEWATVGACA